MTDKATKQLQQLMGDYLNGIGLAEKFLGTLTQIAELHHDQGHDAVRLAREILGMEVERWGCHCDLEDGEEPDTCLMGTEDHCIYKDRLAKREDCQYWQRY